MGTRTNPTRSKRPRPSSEESHSKSQEQDLSLTPPETPPNQEYSSLPSFNSSNVSSSKRRKLSPTLKTTPVSTPTSNENEDFIIPLHQEVLLLHAAKQPYIHTSKQPIPFPQTDKEMLVEVKVIGLNPIDWKAPDFGFGLPTLPCISGRDFAARIVQSPASQTSRFKKGDWIISPSTDYRDSRKSAYQQYAVATSFNSCKIPSHVSPNEAAPLGVAFVAAAIALGICLGVDFTESGVAGPNLSEILREKGREAVPGDVREECFEKLREGEGAKKGDWIAIWGGSSATGILAVKLAKLSGLKVLAIIDVAKNGARMLKYGADLLVDRYNPERAVEIIKSVTKGKLRFGLDTRGKESASLLAKAMEVEGEKKSHLVGLTGLPKERVEGVVYHSVPIKVFHEVEEIGESLMIWLQNLLEVSKLEMLDIEIGEGGLKGVNEALDLLRSGVVNGPRIVVPLDS